MVVTTFPVRCAFLSHRHRCSSSWNHGSFQSQSSKCMDSLSNLGFLLGFPPIAHVLQFHLLYPLLQGRCLCGREALSGIHAIGESCPPTRPAMGICFPVGWPARVATVMETSSKRHRAYRELEVNQVILQMSRQGCSHWSVGSCCAVHDFLRCTQSSSMDQCLRVTLKWLLHLSPEPSHSLTVDGNNAL